MERQKGSTIASTDEKAELALSLWEALVRELIGRNIITEAALNRILGGLEPATPALSDNDQQGRLRKDIRARLERSFPTPLDRADRDRLPDTKD